MPTTVHITDDEAAVLRLLASGSTTAAVATKLRISERTVRRRVDAVCARLGVHTTIEAVVWAARVGAI